MRALLLFTGAPGSGKSTTIKEWGLEPYTISPDNLRLLYQPPVWTPEGHKAISQGQDNKVWSLLYQLVEERMQRGEFTVIDATFSKRADFNNIRKLAKKYRYRIYVYSLRHVSKDVLYERNKHRGLKAVPYDVIDKFVARFHDPTNALPNWVSEIKNYEDFINTMKWKSSDFNEYDKIYHIGDIHGSFGILLQLMKEIGHPKDNPKTAYIFLGDYIDRGPSNKAVLRFLLKIYKLPNVYLLEGNHESNLWHWANNELNKIKSKEFIANTYYDLESGIANNDYTKKEVRQFYRSLLQVLKYEHKGQIVLCNHGGVPNADIDIVNFSTHELIKGVGRYEDDYKIAETWNELYINDELYQIHGHRNISRLPVQNGRVFNLEGRVEFGGYLRVVLKEDTKFISYEYLNKYEIKKEKPIKLKLNSDELLSVLEDLNSNDNVIIKKQKNNEHIVSITFPRRVFYQRKWLQLPLRTRGLFINTNTGKIIARGYEKFFYINENIESDEVNFINPKKYPAFVYKKYNGFLGLIGYDEETDALVFTSKSIISGPGAIYANYVKELFYKFHKDIEDKLKDYLRDNNVNLIFEVIHKNDPHIISYEKEHLVLLDIVKRTLEFRNYAYKELVEFANKFNFEYKELETTIYNITELKTIIRGIENIDRDPTEGAVIEFVDGAKVKVKTKYYNKWKHMRTVVESFQRNRFQKEPTLLDKNIIEFFSWFKQGLIKDEDPIFKTGSLITLRDKWIQETYQTK